MTTLVIWNERASPARARFAMLSVTILRPANSMSPLSGLIWPESWASSVVLPAPLGPMTAWMRPCSTSRLTSSVATMPPKCLDNADTRNKTSVMVTAPAIQQHQPAVDTALAEQHQRDQKNAEYQVPVNRERG